MGTVAHGLGHLLSPKTTSRELHQKWSSWEKNHVHMDASATGRSLACYATMLSPGFFALFLFVGLFLISKGKKFIWFMVLEAGKSNSMIIAYVTSTYDKKQKGKPNKM